ncbi:succinate dehydrogenase, cytochrome b556 subunit [Blochmannia endosymbiont of Camponotus (Colobopsis) obliquus]|uniref:succinate dehydrogenase, cytochrome b556 subunit n=1 Tax=Blochmannia endosymbiont of Camponotus (Colobopsis) obliquus TaxID=1505597 RepID=UPI00061A5F7F|nr:succinate dehydrogenase, cytochrome b556 subunit [Blochmannia endosymbiont of Camponotus (Colobopsis) obliquus]AKC60491.1 Succinate dehydrogenase cytochrome b556 subunit [Blochmannia endosymbiont of Camponotus (Colobopsis) obliquus]
MKEQRPINLNLRTIHFPLTAVVSILHRISGVVIFIGISVLLWMFDLSISSPEGFDKAVFMMNKNIFKIIIWGVGSSFIYHIISGMRHILIDCALLQTTITIGRISAYIVCLLTIVLSIFIGVIIW